MRGLIQKLCKVPGKARSILKREAVLVPSPPEPDLEAEVRAQAVLEQAKRDQEFAETLITKAPQNIQRDPLSVVRYFRELVYERIATAADENSVLHFSPNNEPLDLEEVFTLMERSSGGTWCAGTAEVLGRIYHSLGLESALYFHGFPASSHHTTVLVKVGERWLQQDPYLNFELVNEVGEPLEFFDALRRMKQGRPVKPHSEEPQVKSVMYSAANFMKDSWLLHGDPDPPLKITEKGQVIVQTSVTYAKILSHFSWQKGMRELRSRGYSPRPVCLAMFPTGMTTFKLLDSRSYYSSLQEPCPLLKRIIRACGQNDKPQSHEGAPYE